MTRLGFDTILEECINLLKAGKSVSDCEKIYGKSEALTDALSIVQIGIGLPKKDTVLDKDAIWHKISTNLGAKQKRARNAYHPFSGLRLAFPQPVVSLITILVIIGLINATAVAAQNSVPGETLYPVKKTVEKLQLTLTLNDEKKTEVRIRHAEIRLEEIATIVETKSSGEPIAELNKKDAETVAETLNALIDTTSKISTESDKNKSTSLLEKVVQLTDKQELVLNKLGTKLSGDTKDAINAALGSALATEENAKKSLEGLGKEEGNITGANATSTEGILTVPSSTSTTSTVPGLPQNNASSTKEGVEALGDPDATGTKEILPNEGSEENTSTNSVLEIIEL